VSGEPKPLKTFRAQSFDEILAEARARPGVDLNDPAIAPLLAELSKDPGFVMIGFSPLPGEDEPDRPDAPDESDATDD
jgi:hypothetical protein